MDLEKELCNHFGYSTFRLGQREVIQSLLNRENVLAMLPTGTGKSICFQLPALLLPGTAVVVSPLLSLMEDQVQQLKSQGIKKVTAINSFLSFHERKKAIDTIDSYDIVYISPESLMSQTIMDALSSIKISLFVIDEAHCISQWGHDFRTDYLKLGDVWEQLSCPPCLAITATATKEVQKDIVAQLRLPDVTSHIFSVHRPNIAIQVEKYNDVDEKLTELLNWVNKLNGPGLIYASSRIWAENLAARIQSEGTQNVAYYHGGLENDDRLLIQQQFINGQLDVICCTNAFGMGINKNNVRYVIHFHFPQHMEAYLQEIGRAGRDGQNSLALLLYSDDDRHLPLSLIEHELPNKKQLQAVNRYLEMLASSGLSLTSDDEIQIQVQMGLTEGAWRILYYHLQLQNVIHLGNVNKQVLPYAMKFIERKVESRLEEKFQKVQEMINFIECNSCKRAYYLSYFEEKLDQKPINCCDYCGLSLEDYMKNNSTQTKKLNNLLPWQDELKRIFHQL
ncbi:RecQ family ATP-dependent DNA helicase [Alkalihalobacterium chitinilyticum]|uniref:ATP-dependent DNA helicase RecQ n=1 Tax=Alkalihalobacterium chitinilyticum TaxID=2980103 RepID=A0ABT5V9G5_9BACI|nr:ATP-dependent DNA helicase RecQ [Alkalihalobacterium chitinilyticum]MDE5411977.1 ATP-dependent DNA helicase [Alkalihalobacterium chitinilyticum]